MKAIVKGSGLALRDVAARMPSPGEVRVRVAYAGVCRTDLYVADGHLPAPLPRILGHELSGTTMDPAPGFALGNRVTVRPYVRCERCAGCKLAAPEAEERAPCAAPERLGIERDGAFAEELVVPASMLLALPDALPLRTAAFVEPVAAALAVLRAPLPAGGRGLVPGEHRIAELTRRVLALHGWDVERCTDARGDVDFAVETSHTVVGELVRRLRPRGLLVLKSRPFEPVPLDLGLLVAKEIQVVAVHYGSFARAIALLAEGRLDVADLFAPERALEDWNATFAEARREGAKKQIFRVAGGT